MKKSEDQDVYQTEFWEIVELPQTFAPALFGCRGQWEAMDDEVRADTSEDLNYCMPKFYEDLETGFI